MHRVISRWLRWLNCMHYTSNCFLIHRIRQIWPLVTITRSQTTQVCSRKTDLASRKKSSPKLKLILRLKTNRSIRKVLKCYRSVVDESSRFCKKNTFNVLKVFWDKFRTKHQNLGRVLTFEDVWSPDSFLVSPFLRWVAYKYKTRYRVIMRYVWFSLGFFSHYCKKLTGSLLYLFLSEWSTSYHLCWITDISNTQHQRYIVTISQQ